MPDQKLIDLLESRSIPYRAIMHSCAYTAAQTAATAEVPVHGFAKTVMVKINRQMAMVVVPAAEKVNCRSLRQATGAATVEIAREEEFKDLFPDCEVGAMPPIGKLYGLPQFVDARLSREREVVFNAGTHTELVALDYQAYEDLVSPEAVRLVQ